MKTEKMSFWSIKCILYTQRFILIKVCVHKNVSRNCFQKLCIKIMV